MTECSFTVKERVVYPGQGVGEIVEISEKKFKDEMLTYYVIYFDESQAALAFLSEKFDPIPSDWKMRYQMNLDLFKTGSILDNASIVRSLYHRSKIKELPIQERKLYDSAYRIFYDELSYALQKSKSEIETMIHSYLEVLSKNASGGKQDQVDDDMFDDGMNDMDDDFDDYE